MRGEVSVPVEVRLGACLCAGSPHSDGDYVLLAPKLGMAAGHAGALAIAEGGELSVTMTAAIARHSIVAWNLTDPEGKAVEITPGNVDRYLPWNEGGKEVAAKALELYIIDRDNSPFSLSTSRRNSKNSSPPTPTESPTSPSPRSSSKRQLSSALQSVPASAGAQ